VAIKNDTIHWHQTIRINYTTYDVRREQCLINPKQQGDVMMYSNSPDDILPYCFARVEGIMKVNVVYTGTQPPLEQEIPVLWVRWYELCNEEELGWDTRRIPQIGFADDKDEEWPGYGFIDPKDVIRAVHLIPSFGTSPTTRRGTDINPFSLGRQTVEEYKNYYVNW
jgi:hypothetical protein